MLEPGRVVRSVAGHDRDRFYVVVDAAADRVGIADGKARKLTKPKAKNTLHVRPTDLILDMQTVTTDKKLRQALSRLNNPAREEGGEIVCQR